MRTLVELSVASAPRPIPTSPFERGAVAGLPFNKGSEEARAIRAVIEANNRERAARSGR
jgi:hypothetical protein